MVEVIKAAQNGYKKKLDSLLANGYSVHCQDEKQATALFWGACRGYHGICMSLVEAGADINAQNNWGATPLHAAAERGNAECIKVLLRYKANINVQNNRGDTPMHLACYRGFTDIVSLLLNSGADITLENNQGKTPYVEAHSQKHIAILRILEPHMYCLKQKKERITQQSVPPLANVHYSTENYQNSYNSSSTFSGSSNMRTISFSRRSEAQENEDISSLYEPESLNAEMNILNLDRDKDISNSSTTDLLLSSHQHLPSWITEESVDCNKPEQRQTNAAYFKSEMLRMRKSLGKQSCLIQKLQEENEKLKETTKLREVERVRADTHCRKMALQIARLSKPSLSLSSISDDSNSLSDLSDHSASPHSPNCIFPFPKYPLSMSGPTGPSGSDSCSSLNNNYIHTSTAVSDPQNFSHKPILELYQLIPDWKLLDFGLITKKVSDIWLQVSSHNVELDQNDRDQWILGQHYELRDKSPLNRGIEEQGNGTCSLVFRIKFKNHNLILKMMTNLIDLHYHGHNHGHSLDGRLHCQFGPELIPVELPPHRNLIQIIHHYTSTTFDFQQFNHLMIRLDGVEMAYRTLFFVMHEYPQNLKSLMENTNFNFSLGTFLLQQLYQLLSAVYLLENNHIAHRDLKPDNIFLDSTLRPILADFGFAKKLRNLDGRIPVTHLEQIKAANGLAWTPEMIRWINSVDPITNLTEEDVYKYTDSYSIGRMFYTFLMIDGQKFPEVSSLHPHYNKDDLPDLPSFYSPGLRYVLQQLVLDEPSERMTTRQAMLWTGMLLFPPSPEEMTQKLNVKHYLQAKLMTLLVMKPTVFPTNADNQSPPLPLNVEESIHYNSKELEADFLCNVTVDEFWDIYQKNSSLFSNQTKSKDFS